MTEIVFSFRRAQRFLYIFLPLTPHYSIPGWWLGDFTAKFHTQEEQLKSDMFSLV